MAIQDPVITDAYFFLCNPDWPFSSNSGEVTKTEDAPKHIRSAISEGTYSFVTWSCDTTKKINVGDRAYLVRSGSSPIGIVAAGNVIAAAEDEQLRNIDPSSYANLSETYVAHVGQTYYVCLKFDSVVDYDFPLEQKNLKNLPPFQGVNFHFQGGGKQFAPSNPKALQALASEWEKHSLIQQRQGRGRRLVDVFLEQGEQAQKDKNYESAIGYYQKALEVDPTYLKAINKLKICQSIIDREKSRTRNPNLTNPDSTENGKSNSPSQPTPQHKPTFQDELAIIRGELDSRGSIDSSATNEARKRILVSIARRQGQTKFRQILLEAYGYKCAITGFDAEAALEAAHIIPYVETENNDPTNGLLLRADLHTLFDLNLLAIHPDTMQVFLCPTLQGTEYRAIHEKQVRIPAEVALRPDPNLLRRRLKQFDWLNAE